MKRKRIISLTSLLLTAALSVNCTAVFADELKYGWQGFPGASPYLLEDNTFADRITIIDDTAYVFDSSGNCSGPFTGFGIIDHKRVYYKDGVPFTNGWITISGHTYYFYPDGSFATGIKNIGGKQYNFDSRGELITSESRDAFSLTADKQSVYMDRNDQIIFTVTANNISNYAAVGNSVSLEKYSGGSWYKVEPGALGSVIGSESLNTIQYIGNVGSPAQYRSSHSIRFTPEIYSPDLTEGRYRAVVNVMTDKEIKALRCEFDILSPTTTYTSSDVYYTNTTEKITFTTVVNTDCMVYTPQITEIYYFDKTRSAWTKVAAPAENTVIAVPVYAPAGSVVTSTLDLNRYGRGSMKEGKYRAVIGDGITKEFELKNPFNVSVYEDSGNSEKVKKVKVAISNTTPLPLTIGGYGQLYRLTNGKWKAIGLTKGKTLDTYVNVPSMKKVTATLNLTDYYPYTSLKSGSYCMRFPAGSNSYMYAYFSL